MVSMSEINKHQTPRDTHTHPKKHTEIDSARLVTPPAELLGTRRSGFFWTSVTNRRMLFACQRLAWSIVDPAEKFALAGTVCDDGDKSVQSRRQPQR